jgi:hypothetical protein
MERQGLRKKAALTGLKRKEVIKMLRKRYQLRAIAHCKEGC